MWENGGKDAKCAATTYLDLFASNDKPTVYFFAIFEGAVC